MECKPSEENHQLFVENFVIHLKLTNSMLKIEIDSQLDGLLYELKIDDEKFNQQVSPFFSGIKELKKYLLINEHDRNLIKVDDLGNLHIGIVLIMSKEEKNIKEIVLETKKIQRNQIDVLRNIVRNLNLKIKHIITEFQPLGEKIQLTIAQESPFKSYYTLNGNICTRNANANGNWAQIYMLPITQHIKKFYFSVKIKVKASNQIHVGIINPNQIKNQSSLGTKDTYFYNENGNIYDQQSTIRRGCVLPIGAILTVAVDTVKRNIRWIINGAVITGSPISQNMTNNIFPSIHTTHVNDSFELSPS